MHLAAEVVVTIALTLYEAMATSIVLGVLGLILVANRSPQTKARVLAALTAGVVLSVVGLSGGLLVLAAESL